MKAKPDSPAKKHPKPVATVTSGSIKLKIHRVRHQVGDKVYQQFRFNYMLGNERVRKRFADFEEAKREAQSAADKLAAGDGQALRLTSIDRANHVQALEVLRNCGRPLIVAVQEYADALALLPPGASLREAVTDFAHRKNSIRESRMVSELVREYIAAKEQAGRSEAHMRDLRLRLTRFGEAFQMPVAQVTGKGVQLWLDGMKRSNRTKLNELRIVTALLRFAVRRKDAPRDLLDELEAVERPDVTPSPTLIFSTAEFRELLAATEPKLLPWLVFGGFCGLRSAEILRLDWRDVNFKRRFVEVTAANAKTAQRRLVTLCDAAIAWLTPLAQSEGRVACHQKDNWFYCELEAGVNRKRREAGIKAKFKWKRNGLRHSFCSYRLAVTQDMGKVALEAGNSAAMIFAHYRELCTEDEAKEWFASMPPKQAENVITLPQVAAA